MIAEDLGAHASRSRYAGQCRGQSLTLGMGRPESSSYFILSGSVISDKSVNLAVSL